MIRVLTIVGARPQFIKAAVVSRVILQSDGIEELLVHTGQHYDDAMSAAFFSELGIPTPVENLGIGSGSHAVQTGRMLPAIESSILRHGPTVVLLYGDTNSTLAGAVAAAKLNVPIAHVEAGLRSFNRAMPEEVNRLVADHLSDWLFPPTEGAERQLVAEGLGDRTIDLVGDVMYDAALHAIAHQDPDRSPVRSLGLAAGAYLLVTIHRAENTDRAGRLGAIVEGLSRLAAVYPVVFPMHPRTRAALDAAGLTLPESARLRVLPPQSYFAMQALEASARLVVTDSGGVQKEAFWHGVPCVTLRRETEWTELVDCGWNRLAEPDPPERLLAAVEAALADPRGVRPAFYGDGQAGERIVRRLRAGAG